MKKVITTILSLVLIFTFAIGLTGCGGSDEALRRGENNFGSGRLGAGCDRRAGNTVTVTDDDDFFAF